MKITLAAPEIISSNPYVYTSCELSSITLTFANLPANIDACLCIIIIAPDLVFVIIAYRAFSRNIIGKSGRYGDKTGCNCSLATV